MKRFDVYETFHGYAFEDIVTGEIREIGDGVDAFTDEEGEAVTDPETILRLFQESLNADVDETLEAYGIEVE